MSSFVGRWFARTKSLWRRALEENASPAKFAWAVAGGAFISAGPFYGLRTGGAYVLAWGTKLNRLTTVLSSHILSGPFGVAAVVYEVRLGSMLLRRPAPAWPSSAAAALDLAKHALLAWVLGGLIVAPFFAALAGLIAYPIAKAWRARKERAEASKV